MRVKFPITDQFLWLVYEFFEKTGEVLEPLGVFKLRSWSNIVPLGEEIWKKLEKKRRRRQFAQFINYLKRQGYIKSANLKGKKGILLTPKGKRKALKIRHSKIENSKSLKRRKDKRWIMIIFDIPEKRRRWRDDLRGFLYSLGFQPLQKSVWISPYDVLDRLREIITTLGLDQYVRIFLIEETEI